MQRSPVLRRFNRVTRLPAWVAVMSASVFAAHAHPQGGGEVELQGYVAPRCWIVDMAAQSPANPLILPGRVVCNHAMPLLRSSVRQLDRDGRILNPSEPAGLMRAAHLQSSRAALEIVVSPQI